MVEVDEDEERKRPPEVQVACVKPPLRNEDTVIETDMAAGRISGSSTSHLSTHQEESSNAGEDNHQAASSSVQQVRRKKITSLASPPLHR